VKAEAPQTVSGSRVIDSQSGGRSRAAALPAEGAF